MAERKVQLSFEPIAHKYTDETGLVYTSATTLVGQYKEPFNKKYWSMYTSLKNAGFKVRPTDDKKGIWVDNKYKTLDSLYKNPINNYQVKALTKHWEDITEIACDRGNEVHDYLEDSINLSKGDIEGVTNEVITPQLSTAISNTGLDVIVRTVHDLDKTTIKERFPEIYYRLLDYIKIGCIIFAEKRIYSTTYQIAGMIDVLIVHPKSKMFCIMDWKTNKDKMHFQNGYYKKIKVGNDWVKSDNYILMGKKLLYPVNNLDDCKGMLYSLQLSLYAYIMELWGYKLVAQGLEIFHIRPNLSPKLIKIDYKKTEIEKMLKHHYNKNILKLTPKSSKESFTFGIHKK